MTATPLSDPEVRARLAERDVGSCTVWQDHPLPPGCAPARARIGVERPSGRPVVLLLVDRGVAYEGPHEELSRFFAEGAVEFDTLSELLAWCDYWLLAAGVSRPAAAVTDLDAVVATEPEAPGRCFIDRERLRGIVSARVRGQDTAIDEIASRLRTHLAQTDPRRPLSILAVGPSGVGKTATAEVVAESLEEVAGRAFRVVRVDLNEYRERHRVSSLLGAPAGYTGYGDRPELIEALGDARPTFVIFDEVDKAHGDVLVTLMNAIDSGRLTDGRGETVDCRDAVFFFTSNQAADAILAATPLAAAAVEVDRVCREQLMRQGLASWLIGRMRSVVLFRPLDARARAEVAVLTIVRLARRYGIELVRVAPEVVSAVLAASNGPAALGVRMLEHDSERILGDVFADFSEETEIQQAVLQWSTGGPVLVGTTSPEGRSIPDSEVAK